MHIIEKNICENLIGTFLKIAVKTKDTINARVDLEEMGVRSNLHMVKIEDGESCKMLEAPYVLSKKKQKLFCDFISSVKFQDGYASNLSRCIVADGCKLQRLKTQDFAYPTPKGFVGLSSRFSGQRDIHNYCGIRKLLSVTMLQNSKVGCLAKTENRYPNNSVQA
jgi:hypothetical protein